VLVANGRGRRGKFESNCSNKDKAKERKLWPSPSSIMAPLLAVHCSCSDVVWQHRGTAAFAVGSNSISAGPMTDAVDGGKSDTTCTQIQVTNEAKLLESFSCQKHNSSLNQLTLKGLKEEE